MSARVTNEELCIRADYVCNPGPTYFVDDVATTRGVTFQPDVYTFAEWTCELAGLTTIADAGCGWGEKLAAINDRHPDWDLLGIDHGPNIAHCRDAYAWGVWEERDLEEEFALDARDAVVICSDVIEHLVDPRPLLRTLRGSSARAIVLSTPERDLQLGVNHVGPPVNRCHVREWNGVELAALLTTQGLRVRHVGLTRGNDQGTAMATQLVVCTP